MKWRSDNIWSQPIVFRVGRLITTLVEHAHRISTVDVYYDPRTLKAHHQVALQKAVREMLVGEFRDLAKGQD